MQFNNTMSVLSIMLVRHYIQTGNKLKEKLNHYMCGDGVWVYYLRDKANMKLSEVTTFI